MFPILRKHSKYEYEILLPGKGYNFYIDPSIRKYTAICWRLKECLVGKRQQSHGHRHQQQKGNAKQHSNIPKWRLCYIDIIPIFTYNIFQHIQPLPFDVFLRPCSCLRANMSDMLRTRVPMCLVIQISSFFLFSSRNDLLFSIPLLDGWVEQTNLCKICISDFISKRKDYVIADFVCGDSPLVRRNTRERRSESCCRLLVGAIEAETRAKVWKRG